LDTSKGSDENGHYALSGSKNYYFGMKLELPFVMPKGGKVTTYNGSEEDMIFEFSGDDDIWVFVDKKLVLDLGGIHDSVSGTINFATGKVETKGNHFDEATGQYSKTASSVTIDSSYVKSLTVGRHTLQVYFLERGGAVSNCKITFRLQEDKTPVETIAPTQEPMGPTLGPTVDSTKEPSKEATKEPEVIVTNEPGYNNTGGNENDEISEPSIEPTDIIVDVDGGTSVGIGTPETVDSRVEKEIDNSKDLSSNTGLSESTNNSEGNKVEDRGFALFDDATPLGFLPKTGTISEVVFYVVGALLVIVAVAIVVVTVAKKKSGAKKNADDE
jgi:fibro-slime domain-containing protein/LPXTG-motif cell wall-anchored protein